ncbi:hypothetical protein [Aliikangiella maris]|uniref:Uncharacterized protein n=2 Tax=Aliikangiella maris TaxID=3162458 RepID=A0ABV3MLT3_9GAMM
MPPLFEQLRIIEPSITTGAQNASAAIAGKLEVKARILPPPPAPEIDIQVWFESWAGDFYADVKVSGGIYISGEFSTTGTIKSSVNNCEGEDFCLDATLEPKLALGLSGGVSGESCFLIDSFFELDGCGVVSIGLALNSSVSGKASYNCKTGLGGTVCFDGVDVVGKLEFTGKDVDGEDVYGYKFEYKFLDGAFKQCR